MRRVGVLLLMIFLLRGAEPPRKHRVLFNRFLIPDLALFIADADGKNERPLVQHREIEYSPSVSLDGKWVVFTAEHQGLADIYRVHPDGSGLEQLTSDPAFDDQGAISPDDATLAFVSTRASGTADIWLLNIAKGEYRNLTHNHSGNFRPSWSPDGQWIAFSSDRDTKPGALPGSWEQLQSTGIYIVHPDGTGLRRLTREGGFAGSPVWSADSRRVLYYETDEVGAYMAKSAGSRTELVALDISSGERTQFTASNVTKLSPQWLPDGKLSYVVRSPADAAQGLKVWHPDRRVDAIVTGAVRHAYWLPGARQVVYERMLHRAHTQHLEPTASRDPEFELVLSEAFPSFSPDGTRLLYSQYGNQGTNTADTSIEIMTADGGGKHTLFHKEFAMAFDAVWSPAGDVIAFCVGRYFRTPGFPASQVALIRPDGSGFRPIADDGANNGFPSWSPDGKQIVYKRGRQLVIVSLPDSKVTPLTGDSHWYNFPQWSPKGDAIMFTSDRDGDFELYTVRPDGTGLRRLTNSPGNDAHSIWSPDGEWIVFSSARMGFKDEMALYDGVPQPYGEIFAMRAEGSDVRQLTDNKWEDASPGWMPEPKAGERIRPARPR